MDAYERVLSDAMAGDATLFAREDYVEEAWRIVDPVLKAGTPVHEYEPKTWGPAEVESVTPPGGWSNPVVTTWVVHEDPCAGRCRCGSQRGGEIYYGGSLGCRGCARPLRHGSQRRPHSVGDAARLVR